MVESHQYGYPGFQDILTLLPKSPESP
jgi:hypothetical protein